MADWVIDVVSFGVPMGVIWFVLMRYVAPRLVEGARPFREMPWWQMALLAVVVVVVTAAVMALFEALGW